MATGELDPVAREAELARLPGPKLVDHLCTTHRRADYEAAARVLDARDRWFKAALAENEDLRRKCDAMLGAQRPTREEAEEQPRPGIAAPGPGTAGGIEESEEGEVKSAHFIDLCGEEEEAGRGAGSRVPIREAREDAEGDEDDTVPLSQLWKRRRLGEPGAVKSEKGDGEVQHNSVDSGGSDPRKCTPLRTDVPEALTAQMVSKPEDSMVAAFVQGKGTVRTENVDGEMPRAVLHSAGEVVWSTLQKRKFGRKEGSSVVPRDTTSSQARSTSLTPKKEGSSAVPGYTTSSQARTTSLRSTSLTPKKEGSSAVPGYTTSSQARTTSLTPKKCRESMSPGGKLDSTPTKVGESNKREGELQNKSINSKPNDVLKYQDKEDARMVQKGDLSMQTGNSAMHSAPGGSSRAGSKNGVPARGVNQPPKGNDQMNKMSMVELSSKCRYEKVGADVQKCSPLPRQSEEGNVARGVVSFEETRMATVHPLSIRNLRTRTSKFKQRRW